MSLRDGLYLRVQYWLGEVRGQRRHFNERNIDLLFLCKVSLTIVHCVAIASALFRIYRRKITKRLWWDDTFAAGGLLLDFVFFPTLWLRQVCHVGKDHPCSRL